MATAKVRLQTLHAELAACKACSSMIGPVVHGPPVVSKVMLVGQAPGPREGSLGRPFAWTAGKTLFRWFEESVGVSEEAFRERVYIAAVARCFPGKASGGGDRRPDAGEIDRCRTFLAREAAILKPELILPVGTLAIGEILGEAVAKEKLASIIGRKFRASWHGVEADVVPLPHPSGASPWPKLEPGKTLLARALGIIAKHPAMRAAFAGILATLLVLATPPDALAQAPAASAAALPPEGVVFGLSISVARTNGAPVRDDAWVQDQIATANVLYAPLGVTFRWLMQDELADEHRAMHTRAERDALTSLAASRKHPVIDVFLVAELEDVDEPGRMRKGVCWTSTVDKRRYVILSREAPIGVLGHELGHFFGNPHTTATDNLMSYSRGPGPVFLDDVQKPRIRAFAAGFLASGRLADVGVPRLLP